MTRISIRTSDLQASSNRLLPEFILVDQEEFNDITALTFRYDATDEPVRDSLARSLSIAVIDSVIEHRLAA